MPVPPNIWAKAARVKLITEMGGVCQLCPCTDYKKLEFDHVGERTWDAAKVSSSHRISIYRREWREGKLRLLCRTCNGRDGAYRRFIPKAQREYEAKMAERDRAELAAEDIVPF